MSTFEKKSNGCGKAQLFWKRFKKNWQLHLLILLPLLYVLIFCYWPFYGLQIAWKDYSPRAGIWGSEWVGWENFIEFFRNYEWTTYVKNTIRISLYSILVDFPMPIIFALLLHVNERPFLKKFTQNISYVPHFISVVVLVGIINQIFNPMTGLWGSIIEWFNLNVTGDIRISEDAFPHLYVWSGVWASMGWSAIIYVSALSSVSHELHEAAMLDGASRWKRVIHVDIPAILPTISMMLILRCGSILSVGYEKVYLMQNPLNLGKSEVISTYVYKMGIGENDLSYGTAVNLMNSVINVAMMLLVNWIVKKLSDDEQGLF